MTERDVQELPLEQLEVAFVLYVAGKVGEGSSMTVDDVHTCVETLQRLGKKYVEQARRS